MSDEQLDLGRLQGMVLAAGMIARSCPVEAEEILKAGGVFAGDDLDGCAAFDIKQLIEARIDMPGLHAAWQKARRDENAQYPPEGLQDSTGAGFASVRRSKFIDEVPSPTVKALLETYAGLSNTGDVSAINSNAYGAKWVEETLLEHANAQRSKGTWRRIAYRDFLFAVSALRISPLMAIDTMKRLLVQPDVAGRQLAFLVDVIGDLIGAESPSKTTEDIEWELGEAYAETTLGMSSLPHEPRKWLIQAYMEFTAVLRALGVTPHHVLSTLDDLSKENLCGSELPYRKPSKPELALLQAYAGQQWPAPQDELNLSTRWALLHQPSIEEEQLLIRVYQEVREGFNVLGLTPEHVESVLREHESSEAPLVVNHSKSSSPSKGLDHHSYCRYPTANEATSKAALALLCAYAGQRCPTAPNAKFNFVMAWVLLHQPNSVEEQLLLRVYQEVLGCFSLLGLTPEHVQSVLSEHESSETPPGQQKEPPHE